MAMLHLSMSFLARATMHGMQCKAARASCSTAEPWLDDCVSLDNSEHAGCFQPCRSLGSHAATSLAWRGGTCAPQQAADAQPGTHLGVTHAVTKSLASRPGSFMQAPHSKIKAGAAHAGTIIQDHWTGLNDGAIQAGTFRKAAAREALVPAASP